MKFCKDCKNVKFIECEMGRGGYHCKSQPIQKHDAVHSWEQFEDCTIKNRNNDCQEFVGTRKWARRNKGE